MPPSSATAATCLGRFRNSLATSRDGILSLLDLRLDVGLPDPRSTVPAMVDVAGRHPRLNLLNLEAVAVARLLSGTIWLSEAAAEGILPPVLHAEGIAWRTVSVG